MTDVPPWMRKRPAAIKAVDDHVEDGMIVGIGTGNAACMAADRLAELVRDGFDLGFVSTSEQTTAYARGLGLEALDIDCVESIDVTIDGADEVGPHLDLIKGLGGALLREKIVASMTEKEVIVVDAFKVVDRLGTSAPLPVEVCGFAHVATARALEGLGCGPVLRLKDGRPFVTDGGNLIYDCRFDGIDDPSYLETAIDTIPGVVECGLFVGLTYAVEAYREEDDSVVELRITDRRAGPRGSP